MHGAARLLVVVGLGTMRDSVSLNDSMRTKVIWEEANNRGLQLRELFVFDRPTEFFLVKNAGKLKTFDSLPLPVTTKNDTGDWIDDKWELKTRFQEAEIPVAQGGLARNKNEAARIFESLIPPVVVKPHRGSRSRHTFTNLNTLSEVLHAFESAHKLSPKVIVEEELVGFVYRGTVVGGHLAGIVRREPAMVIGDGVRTVLELIRIENRNPKRDNELFHTIPLGNEIDAVLERQKLLKDSIPAKDRIVLLGDKTSRGMGGGITEITKSVHPDNIELLEKCAQVVDYPIVGFDFIIGDITKSWKIQSRTGIIECNTVPFIDLHHFPLNGTPKNIASMVWELALSAN